MNDLELFVNMLQRYGLTEVPYASNLYVGSKQFSRTTVPRSDYGQGEGEYRLVEVGSGIGYVGFICVFFFDEQGKLVNHGIWE